MPFIVSPHNPPPQQIPLAKLQVWPVTTEADKEHWNHLIEQHHYLRDTRLCGPQIRSMALCLNRLGADWKERYGFAPLVAETFIEKDILVHLTKQTIRTKLA